MTKLLFPLRKENFKKMLPGLLVCILFGIFVSLLFGAYDLPRILAPRTLAEVDPQNMHGVYIDDEVSFIYGSFAQEFASNGNGGDAISGIYYTIDLNEEYYIALFVYDKQMQEAIVLEESSFIHWDDPDPTINANWPTMRVKGSLVPMDPILQHDYYEMGHGDPDLEAIMLPYTLDTRKIGTSDKEMAWFVLGTLIISVLVGLGFLGAVTIGPYETQLFAKLDAMGDRTAVLKKVNEFYRTTPAHYKFRINNEFVLFQQGMHIILLRAHDVARVYKTSPKRAAYGLIPFHKAYTVRLCTIGSETYTLPYKKSEIDRVMAYLASALPSANVGGNKNKPRIQRKMNEEVDLHYKL